MKNNTVEITIKKQKIITKQTNFLKIEGLFLTIEGFCPLQTS